MRISKRLRKRKYFPWYFLSIIGVLLFFFWGSETLSCQRIKSARIDCKKFNTTALGLVTQETFSLNNLKNVQVKQKTKETLETNDSGSQTIKTTPIYGVVLEFEEGKEMVFQGYGYQRHSKQIVAGEIQEFFKEPEQLNLTLFEDRFWQSIFPLALMILPIVFILKIEFFSTSK